MPNILIDAPEVNPETPERALQVALFDSISAQIPGPAMRYLALHRERAEVAARTLEVAAGTSTAAAMRFMADLSRAITMIYPRTVEDLKYAGHGATKPCEHCRPSGADYCCPTCGRMANTTQAMPSEGSAGRRTV